MRPDKGNDLLPCFSDDGRVLVGSTIDEKLLKCLEAVARGDGKRLNGLNPSPGSVERTSIPRPRSTVSHCLYAGIPSFIEDCLDRLKNEVFLHLDIPRQPEPSSDD